MKNMVFVLVAFFSFVGSVQANECPAIREQQTYNINQKLLTIGSDFDIPNNGHNLGKIVQRVFSWGKAFELQNENGQLVARAQQQVFSFGVKVDVYDCNNRMLGSLHENIFKSLFKVHTVYSILNGNGQLVGQSKKLDFFGTDISFFNSSGKLSASLSRPFINWLTDKWVLTLHDANNVSYKVDSRILFFTAAYKTSADSSRKSESSNSSSKR